MNSARLFVGEPKMADFADDVALLSGNGCCLGMGFGFLTESNKPFIRFGVTGPILKSTTEVTWAGLGEKTKGEE